MATPGTTEAQSATIPTAELTFALDELEFVAGDGDSDGATFSGVLMRGAKVVNGWGGRLWVRPEIFAAENGKVVPLDVNHARFPAAGAFTIEVSRQQVRAAAGRFLPTQFGRDTAVEMQALLDAGVKLEMSLDLMFDPESERATTAREPGDYTFDRAMINCGSVVLRGLMNGTSFRMSADWRPSRDYSDSESDSVYPQEATGVEHQHAGGTFDADSSLCSATDSPLRTETEAARFAAVAELENL